MIGCIVGNVEQLLHWKVDNYLDFITGNKV